MNGISETYAMLDAQNYNRREISIIYSSPENLKPRELHRLVDKAIDKYDDWRVATFLLHKYDVDGKIR